MSLSTTGTAFGTVLAVVAAVAWAGQYLFVRVGTERGSVSDAMLVALACNVALVVPITGLAYYPEYGLSVASLVYFGAAGVAGSFLSRILQFESTRTVGASRTAPTVSASSLVSAFLAVLFLDERLTSTHLIGIVLIVGAVAVLSWETAGGSESAPSLREAGSAMALPVSAALVLGVEPILLKFGLAEGTPQLVGLAVMVTAAFVVFLLYRGVTGGRARPSSDPLGRNLRWYAGAGVAGTAALLAYVAALESAPVVVVVPILQTAPLFVIAFSAAFLPRRLERVTWRVVAAGATVVVGTVLVSLSG